MPPRILDRFVAAVTACALIVGLSFPLWGASHVLDEDDPSVRLTGFSRHAIQQFEQVYASAPADHCVLCHSWRALGSASPDASREVLAPPAAMQIVHASIGAVPIRRAVSTRSSRAPPSIHARAPQIHA